MLCKISEIFLGLEHLLNPKLKYSQAAVTLLLMDCPFQNWLNCLSAYLLVIIEK